MPNAYGRRNHTRDPRDYRARATRAYTGEWVTLEPNMPPVWDQEQLGACVEFATGAAWSYARTKAGLPYMEPAQLFGYYAARERAGYPVDEDTGLEIRDGFASLAHDGLPPTEDWPYNISRFAERPGPKAYQDAAERVAAVYGAVDPDGVDDMIASGWPVVIGFDVYESFEGPGVAANGVMPVPGKGEQQVGGHAVVLLSTPRDGADIPGGIVGVKYRRARNSWGPEWGDRGYFWYPVPAMPYASDIWQVTTVHEPVAPVPPGPAPAPGVDPATVAFAAACEEFRAALEYNNWINSPHCWGTRRIARAARPWVAAEVAWRASEGL